MSKTIKALLIDPDAHGRGEDGVQAVESPTKPDGRDLDISESKQLLGCRSFESADSLLFDTARNASLYVDSHAPDDGTHWCWTWGLSEPVIGKNIIVDTDDGASRPALRHLPQHRRWR